MWMDFLFYRREGGASQSSRRKTPTNSPKICITYMIFIILYNIRGENSLPQPGIEPTSSNIGDTFVWSEHAGSNLSLTHWTTDCQLLTLIILIITLNQTHYFYKTHTVIVILISLSFIRLYINIALVRLILMILS